DAEPTRAVGGDQPDGVAAPRRQRAPAAVRGEAELLGGPPDALAGLRTQLPGVVERLRRGAGRDPGERGDVGDADDAGAATRHPAPLSARSDVDRSLPR